MRYRSLPVENGVTGAPPLFHLSHSLRRMKGIVYRANINGRTAMLGSLFWPKAEKTCKVPPPYIPEHACFFSRSWFIFFVFLYSIYRSMFFFLLIKVFLYYCYCFCFVRLFVILLLTINSVPYIITGSVCACFPYFVLSRLFFLSFFCNRHFLGPITCLDSDHE